MGQSLEEDNHALLAEVARLKAELNRLTTSQSTACYTNQALNASIITASNPAESDVYSDAKCAANEHRNSAAAGAGEGQCPLPTLKRTFECGHGLKKEQVERYSRHLLLPAFGIVAQERVCKGAVLIVGCGGLGSPAALYLAAAGVGRLGLVDHDTVDVTNLHRQIIHTTARVGQHKATSAAASCLALNPTIIVETHMDGIKPGNAVQLVQQYDMVVDASDNPATRYLISDACSVTSRPLVSAAAVGTDGQLTVYCHGKDGPCYRCLFPEAPAPANCARCGDAGVLGVVPGIMGSMQALEAIKLLSGTGEVLTQRLLIFDALAGRFNTVKLRGKRPGCVACGPDAVLSKENVAGYDYVAFTGQEAGDGPPVPLSLLQPSQRITPAQLQARLLLSKGPTQPDAAAAEGPSPALAEGQKSSIGAREGLPAGAADEKQQHELSDVKSANGLTPTNGGPLMLDVRPAAQFGVMALPGAVHVPFEKLHVHLPHILELCGIRPMGQGGAMHGGMAGLKHADASTSSAQQTQHDQQPSQQEHVPQEGQQQSQCGRREVVVMCRRGNNSQLAVQMLVKAGITWAQDVEGGYTAWAQQLDPDMPIL